MSTREIVGKPALRADQYITRKSTDYIVLHCAQTNAHQDFGVEDIRQWHTLPPPKGNGWKDVGYHYVIRRNGVIERGRAKFAIGAHVKGYNHNSVGICLVGGCDEEGNEENNFTDEQWDALKWLVGELRCLYPKAEILGHRDFPNVHKYCPSFDARAWAKENGFQQ